MEIRPAPARAQVGDESSWDARGMTGQGVWTCVGW